MIRIARQQIAAGYAMKGEEQVLPLVCAPVRANAVGHRRY